MKTEKILGKTYRVGTKWHARAVEQKKHFDDLGNSETNLIDFKQVQRDEMEYEARAEMEHDKISLDEQFEFIFLPYLVWK